MYFNPFEKYQKKMQYDLLRIHGIQTLQFALNYLGLLFQLMSKCIGEMLAFSGLSLVRKGIWPEKIPL